MSPRLSVLLLCGVVALPGLVSAQVGAPHPTMPWSGLPHRGGGVNYGQAIRYIEVPPRPIALPVFVPGPGSFSGEYQPQLVEIPGYVVTETTTGYLYPERWSVQEVTQGVYQWVRLPQQFQPK